MSSPAPSKPPQPYRDFLTPLVHRRFTQAALLSLGLCYAYAIVLGGSDLLWRWFPLGPAGVRTSLFFISTLCVFILRVARMHVGPRTTPSEFDTFKQSAAHLSTLQVFGWYLISAFIFSEAYLWSFSSSWDLGIINYGKSYERPRLNDRPIFLRAMVFTLACVQSTLHLYYDYDKAFTHQIDIDSANIETSGIVSGGKTILQNKILILHRTLWRMIISLVLGVVGYVVFLRYTAFYWTYSIARLIITLPKSSRPPDFSLRLLEVVWLYVLEACLIVLLWEVSNSTFDTFVFSSPMKGGSPITAGSKDPNGSLLAGMKAKKEIIKNSAFWELLIITLYAPGRRKTIFTEIDRAGTSTWSQIAQLGLGETHAMVKRIQDYQRPPSAPQLATATSESGLPRLAAPLHQENIVQKPRPPTSRFATIEKGFGDFAKAHGQSPGADPISPRARKLLTYGADALLSKEQQKELSAQNLTGKANYYVIEFLKSPFGVPFRQTFRRKVLGIVLGAPNGSSNNITNAIVALAKLAQYSLAEDGYGNVQKDVPNLIRTYTTTHTILSNLVHTLQPHWTDVEFNSESSRRIKEVEAILMSLRTGLSVLLNNFGEYADNLGLTLAELRLAKEAVAKGPFSASLQDSVS